MLLFRNQLPFILLTIQLLLWRADAWFALAGIVRVQSACVQSSLWTPAPALVQNLCLRCYCVNAIFSLSICSVIPNLFNSAGVCVPFPVVPTTTTLATTTTTTRPPIILPTVPGIGGILPAIPGVGGAGQILPAQPGVSGAGQILPAQPISPSIQSVFPGLGNYLPGSINTLGGIPATLSPGSGIAGFGFTAPNANFNTLGGAAFPGLFQGKRK